MAVVSPELVLRWAASAGVLVTGAGFTTAMAPQVPSALIWGAAFVVFVAVAVAMWRRRLDELELDRHRRQNRPDTPYQVADKPYQSTKDEPDY